jgi:ethanolamine utilization protein EutN
MFLAKIVNRVVAVKKHPAYSGKRVFIARTVNPDGSETGEECVAVDTVGAGIGDTVVCGGAPGAAQLDQAPIRTLIMAIVDAVECRES